MTQMPRYENGNEFNAAGQAPPVPSIMNTVAYLLLGAALMCAIAAVFGVINTGKPETRALIQEQLAAQKVGEMSPEMLDSVIMISMVTIIAVAVVSVIAYVLLAYFLRKGMGWARIVAGVLAVISLTQLVGVSMPSGIFVILQVLLGLGAVALCFTGKGAEYFRARQQWKLANRRF